MKSIFVAGTDTEVGKTTVTLQLMRALQDQGQRVVGIKPVAAGCEQYNGQWQNDDARLLREYASITLPYGQVNPVALPLAASPHIAAKQHGVSVSVASVKAALSGCEALDVDTVLYEGAGGWFCPINATETMADVVVACGWPVILVVEMRLGCLNITKLTVLAIRAAGVPLLGWVANSRSELMPHYRENMAMLKATIDAPLLAEVHQGPVCHDVDAAMLL